MKEETRKNKFYCWREVETGLGFASQYLDAEGNVVGDSSDRAYFDNTHDAQAHCEYGEESGEASFSVQECLVRDVG